MAKQKLREAIAAEAARLILRGKENEYRVARKRAARWLSRRKVGPEDMPSSAEIQSHLYTLAGLFTEEQQRASLFAIRRAALELMELLDEFQPRLSGCAVEGPVLNGSAISLHVAAGSADDVTDVLQNAGFRPKLKKPTDRQSHRSEHVVFLHHVFPCEISVSTNGCPDVAPQADEAVSAQAAQGGQPQTSVDTDGLRRLFEEAADRTEPPAPDVEGGDEHQYHPDAFATMQLLLSRLDQVALDTSVHPEGDALYHSLQVFELGLHLRPYDEEFLLACLLHDAGMAIDRRNPLPALLQALGELITPRTRFLIENLAAAAEFLQTGQMPRSLRRSENFEDLVLLARCDRDGRVPGAPVRDLDEALDYVQALETAWDE